MFTGLIESTGAIVSVEHRAGSQRITIAAPAIAGKLQTGDSVAVSGVCLTALDIEPPLFHADLAAETVARTSLSLLEPGSTVNLELPTPAGTPLGGHVVQGHVDGTGTLLSLTQTEAKADPKLADWWLRIAVPPAVSKYVVEKGSIPLRGGHARWRHRQRRHHPAHVRGDESSFAQGWTACQSGGRCADEVRRAAVGAGEEGRV
jgi:riboflavin synthase